MFENIFATDLSSSKCIEKLRLYGICIVKKHVSKNELKQLNDFHSKVLDRDHDIKGRFSLQEYQSRDGGSVGRVKTAELGSEFATVLKVFNGDDSSKLCKDYFGKDFDLNDEIFCTHEKESEDAILPWHFDREQSLKFYMNLIDVDKSNGAFEYSPGSHREGRYRANYYSSIGTHLGKMPNDIPDDEIINPITIEAEAGDLIVFDSDGFHRGGIVSPGKQRKVIRAHSHPLPRRRYKPRLFDAHWWLASPLNISKTLAGRSGRILTTNAQSAATRTRSY